MIAIGQISVINVDDGYGIDHVEITYAIHTSATSPPGSPITDGGVIVVDIDGRPLTDGDWSTTIPEVPNGYYLWTRTITYYTGGDFSIAYNVGYSGTDGVKGDTGLSISAEKEQWYLSNSNSSLTGGSWTYTEPTEVPDGKFLWGRLEFTMSDGSKQYSDAVYRSVIGGLINVADEVNKKITQKIWQSDINASINSYDSSTAQSIRDRVTQTESDINGITSTVSDMESILETKADNSTVTTLSNTVSQNEQTASQFRQTVTSTYAKLTDVDNKIGNIRIGGNNLYLISTQEPGYLHSNGSGTISGQSSTYKEQTSDYISVKEGENYILQSWATPTTSGGSWLAYEFFNATDQDLVDENNNTLINENNQTLVVTAMTPVGGRVAKYGSDANSGVETTADGQERLTYSITIPSGANRLRVSYRSYDDGMCMVEKATTPSEYAINPKDIEGYADALVASTKSEIKQTTDSISLEVSRKVGTDEVISRINQSPENITISADKIDLEGQVTFNMFDSATQTQINNTNNTALSAVVASKAYTGTCSTAAGTAAKVVTCTDTDFDLVNGVTITITFSTASTVDAPTLNVNSKGAKNIYFDRATVSSSNRFRWQAGSVVTFQYNGTNWVVINYENLEYFMSSTTAGTAAKVNATATGTFVLCNGATINMYFSTANSADAPTLNIGGTGAFAINYKNAVTSASNKYLWDAGATLTFTFNGSYWYVNDGGSALVKAYAKTSVDWVGTNGQGVLTAKSIINNWATDATSATTTIKGGLIQTHTITADQLATDAIMSSNFIAGGTGSPYSGLGTFLDLATGNIYMPNFGVDAQTGAAFFNGTIIADSGSIGSDNTNYWNIGTFTDYDGNDSAGIVGMGTSYIQSGKWMISQDRIDTRWYDSQRKYTYSTKDQKYWDYGLHAPDLSSSNDYDKIFLYVRKSAGNTIPVLESGWDYPFKVDSDGNVYANSLVITGDGSNDTFLPRAGGTITGNLTVNGTLTATASKANQLTHSISINGKSFDGSANVTVGTIGAAYGGTGQTSLVNSANALINALGTGSDVPVDNDYYISQYVNGGTSTTTYYRRPMSKLWSYIKNKLDSAYDFSVYRLLTNNDFDTANITDANVGNLVVTGAGRFTNGLYGNLTGDVTGNLVGTATYATIVKDSGNNTDITFAYSKAGLSSTSWFAAWNGRELRAISPSNTKTVLGLNNVDNTADADKNVLSATKFSSAKEIKLIGDVTGSATTDGSSGWSITTTIADSSHEHKVSNIIHGDSAFNSNLDPITQAYIGSAASNKSFGLPAEAITIEYSTDGGSTWQDYGATDAQKRNLFAETRESSFYLGKGTTSATNTVNNRLRITIEPTDRYVTFNGIYVWFTAISNTCRMNLERSTIGAKDTFTTVFTDQPVSGWSGNNIRYFPDGQFGGGSTQTSNYYKYRITFYQTAINSSYSSAYVSDIRFIGKNVYGSPNSMVSKNHLYSWDNLLNATFPAHVTATQFVGSLSGNATTATTAGSLTTGRDFTIGKTKKTAVKWDSAVSFTKADISDNASTTEAGWMSAADKSKLESITVMSGGVISANNIAGANGITATYDETTGITTVKHSNTAITAGTASGTSSTSNLAFGATVSLPSITYDAYGHITANGTTSFKLPAAPTTITGNAGTATKLQNARNISVGDITKSFDGSAAISFPTEDMGIIWSDVNPIKTKTYTGVTVEGNSDPAGWLYFFKAPSTGTYYDQWHITYRITATMAGQNDGKQTSIVHIDGMKNTYACYYTWNSINNTSYRPFYGHPFYPTTDAGRTGKYGPIFGLRFQSSYEPTNSTYARTVTIEILEEEGCEVTFFDSPVLYANVPGTGSTNFGSRSSFDGTTAGLTMNGDRNNYDRTMHTYTHLTAGSGGMMQYSLVMEDADGTWQSFTTTHGTGTSKAKNTAGFKLGRMYYMYMSGNIAAGAVNGNSVVYSAMPSITITYSINSGATLHANQPLWIVGTMNNGLFYLDDVWWTQTPPTSADGKVYIPLGVVYNSTSTSTTASAIDFLGWQGAYYHNGTNFVPYVEEASSVDWDNVDNKPILFDVVSGALKTNGWKTLGGRTSGAKLTVSYNNSAAAWNSAVYSSSLLFGVNDTKGMLDIGHANPIVTFAGSSTGNSTDNDPKWYFKLTGTTATTYNLDNFILKSGGTFTGDVTGTSFGASSYLAANTGNSGTAGGLALYGTTPTIYGIAMRLASNGGKHGFVQGDWATYNYMTGDSTTAPTRGWIWKNAYSNTNIASISNEGHAVFNGSVTVGGNATNDSGCKLIYSAETDSLDFVFN